MFHIKCKRSFDTVNYRKIPVKPWAYTIHLHKGYWVGLYMGKLISGSGGLIHCKNELIRNKLIQQSVYWEQKHISSNNSINATGT